MKRFVVYVPKDPRLESFIVRGSAIVGEPTESGRVVVYYEGNLYGSAPTFEDRLRLAAGRLSEGYPTIARAWLEPDALLEVGSYEYPSGRFVLTNEPALEAWT